MEEDTTETTEPADSSAQEESEQVTHEELARQFLTGAHKNIERYVVDAFSSPEKYPFELVHTSLLASIAHSLIALNDKLTQN